MLQLAIKISSANDMDHLKKYEPWLIFFGSLALFLYGLFSRELIGFETRFAVFAQEMLRNGPSFFPTTYGLPYPDYPAGLPFLNWLCALPFGRLTTLSAILPSALASSICLVLIYYIALPINRDWGRIAVLLTLFTYEFFDSARSLTMDPLVMLACTWAALIAMRSQTKSFIFFALPLIFGFCIRGPIGLIMPAGVVVAIYLAQNNWKNLWRFAIPAFILLIILMALLLTAAGYQGGKHFIHDVLIMQIFGRLDDHRTHDFFAYFTNSFVNYALSFELAILSIILCFKHFSTNTPTATLLRGLLFWVLIILIGMSIPEVRKIRYVMPMSPALALLAAYLWIAANEYRAARICVNIFHGICLALPFILIILCIATLAIAPLKGLHPSAHYFTAFITLIVFAIASIYILCHHPIDYATRNPKKVIGIGLASFLAVMIFVVKPIEVSIERVKPFTVNVMMNLKPDQSISFLQLGPDAEPIQFISALPQNYSTKIYFADEVNLQKPTDTLYITRSEIYDDLPDNIKQQTNVILREKLGHRDMVAFTVAA